MYIPFDYSRARTTVRSVYSTTFTLDAQERLRFIDQYRAAHNGAMPTVHDMPAHMRAKVVNKNVQSVRRGDSE